MINILISDSLRDESQMYLAFIVIPKIDIERLQVPLSQISSLLPKCIRVHRRTGPWWY